MNINEPVNSRMLAILIQNIVRKDRDQFLEDARNAKDMDAFLKGMVKYGQIEE
jgi:hypothetical protein